MRCRDVTLATEECKSFSCRFDFPKKGDFMCKHFFLMLLQFMLYNVIRSASFILVRWPILSLPLPPRPGLTKLGVIWAVFYSDERIHQMVNLYFWFFESLECGIMLLPWFETVIVGPLNINALTVSFLWCIKCCVATHCKRAVFLQTLSSSYSYDNYIYESIVKVC